MAKKTFSKKRAARALSRTQRMIARLFVTISALVLMVLVTVNIASVGWKVSWTQIKMVHYHSDIDKYEGLRDATQSKAFDEAALGNAGYARSLQSEADGYDAEVERLIHKRQALRDNTDSIVAWAADGDFDFDKLILGVLVLTLSFGFAALFYHNFERVVNLEEIVLFFALSMIFAVFQHVFLFIAQVCDFERKVFCRVKKKNTANDSANRQRKVVPFKKKRVG